MGDNRWVFEIFLLIIYYTLEDLYTSYLVDVIWVFIL